MIAAALLFAAAAADGDADAARLAGAYRSDSFWAYFRNEQDCSATMFPRGSQTEILVVTALDSDRGTAVGFTRPRTPDMPASGDERMDVRLSPSQSVSDEAWEDVQFTILPFDATRHLFASQPLDAPAGSDFAAMTSIEFLADGRAVARFDVRGAAAALKELARCVDGLGVSAGPVDVAAR